jgi:GntR family transcriptional regulator, rspAB operon transcriptional repressor
MTTHKSPYGFLAPLTRAGRGVAVPRIQDLIREAIVRLDLAPGATIDKAALCARLGVSRFPVSEALGLLADEGFVEILPQRGTRVARIDLATCRQAMFIRRALEADAVQTIASRAGADLLAAIDANLAQQRVSVQADNLARFHELDLAFHALLIDALDYDRVRVAVEAARATRDPRQAARAMEDHLDAVMAELIAFSETHPEAISSDVTNSAAA